MRPRTFLSALVVACALAPAAHATVDGYSPSQLYLKNRLLGSAAVTGSTLTQYCFAPQGNGKFNCVLLPEKSAPISTKSIPPDGQLVEAWLFWSGSQLYNPNPTADFTLPDGTKYSALAADNCYHVDTGEKGIFYYCRKQVTGLLAGRPLLGTYTVGNVEARISDSCDTDVWCQARYAGWSLIVVWTAPSQKKYRDIVIYDGFYHVDEDATSGISPPMTIGGFKVGDPPYAEFTYFGLEGDDQLGEPYQSQLPKSDPLYCETCYDFIKLNGVKLQDTANPPDNVFNSTIEGESVDGVGVDLDTFNVGYGGLGILQAGQTSATVVVGSGDGIVGDPRSLAGGGESVFLGYIVLALDTYAPDFHGSGTWKDVSQTEAWAGDTLTYTLVVKNEGSLLAHDVMVYDAIPANTTYVPGSTVIYDSKNPGRADQPVPDARGGQCPLSVTGGYNAGTIDVGQYKRIKFSVKVTPGRPNVTQVTNQAQISSDETAAVQTNQVTTKINSGSAGISALTKAVSKIGGTPGMYEPGDTLQYRIDIKNDSGADVGNLTFQDDVPAHTTITVVNSPGGSVNQSTATRVLITGIAVPKRTDVSFTFLVKVDDAAQWRDRSKANGYRLGNQGKLSGSSLQGDMLTDDPATPAPADPTVVTLTYAPDFSTSSKTVADLTSQTPAPGDTLEYTITAANTGNRAVPVQVVDHLSQYVDFSTFTLVSAPAGARTVFNAGILTVDGFDLPATAGSAQIKYRVKILALLPAGTVEIKNTANITTSADSSVGATVSSSISVTSMPDLSKTTKAAVFAADDRRRTIGPGEQVRYQINVVNSGNRVAKSAYVLDQVDTAHLDTITPLDGGVFDRAQRQIRWNLGDLQPGERRPIAFTAKARTPLDNGQKIANQALVYSDEVATGVPSDDPATSAVDDPVTLTVVFPYDYTGSAKSVLGDTGGVVKAGDLLTFTVNVVNNSLGGMTNVLVVDAVDRGLTDVNVQGGTYNPITRTINWNIARIDYGRSAQVTFTARVLPPTHQGTVIVNAATLPTGTPQPFTTNTVRLTVAEQPGFTASTKVATPDGVFANRVHRAAAGSSLTYLVNVTNTGTVVATGVTVTDQVDTKDLVNIIAMDGGVLGGGVVTWSNLTVAVGETRTLRLKADVKSPLKNGTQVSNQATITCAENPYPALTDDPDTATASDPTVVAVDSAPDFTGSRKEARVGGQTNPTLRPGDAVTFEITVKNTGNADATGVVVEDAIDTGRLSVQTPVPGGAFDGQKVTWTVGQVGTGDQNAQKVSFTATLKQCVAGQVENTAHISSTELPKGMDTAKLALAVNGASAGGTLSKTVSFRITPVRPGDTVDYAVAYKGADQVNVCGVKLTDVIDKNIETVQVTDGTYDPATRTITYAIQNAPSGLHDFTYRFSARLKKPLKNGTEISNQATLTATNLAAPIASDDPATPAPNDPTRFTVTSAPGVFAVKTADRSQVAPGGTVLYTIALTNLGDAIAEGVTLVDDLSSITGLLDTVTPLDSGTYDPVSHTVSWHPSPLDLFPPNQYAYRFSAKVKSGLPDGTKVSNQAVVKGLNFIDAYSDSDGDPSNGSQPTVVTVVNKPSFSTSTKLPYTATGTPIAIDQGVGAGDQIVYKIAVRNTGTIDAKNVAVTDLIDIANVKGITPAQGGVFDGLTITWDSTRTPALATLKPGDTVDLSFAAQISKSAAPGGRIANQAAVASADGTKDVTDDPRTAAPGDPTVVTVRTPTTPDLSASVKSAAPARTPLKAGGTIHYTITVKNTGAADATGTTVTDQLDAKTVKYVPGSTTLNGAPVADRSGKAPLETGLKASSSRFGANPGANEGRVVPWDGVAPDDETAIVGFDVTVLSGAASVVNRARVDRDGGQPVWLETTTPVGDQPSIREALKTWFLKTDANGNGVADAGDVVEFVISLENAGAGTAKSVVLRDPISDRAAYVPGSMMLERGRPGPAGLTDARDGDEGSYDQYDGPRGAVNLQLKDLKGGEKVRFTFDVSVSGCGGFANQGTVTYDAGTLLTDADGDPANGAQETVVPTCGGEQIHLTAAKEGVDVNGGSLMPGDQILYTVTLYNQSSIDLDAVTLEDDIPDHATFKDDPKNYAIPQGASLQYLKPPTGQYARGRIAVSGMHLPRATSPSEAVKVSFTATVDKTAKKGDQVANSAVVYSPKVTNQRTNIVALAVGGVPGTALVRGRVVQKRDRDETHVTAGKDVPLKDYTVVVEPVASGVMATGTLTGARGGSAVTDRDGAFEIGGLAPGRYDIKAVSGNGVPFARVAGIDLAEGDVRNQDLPIVPAGVVYDSATGAPVEGATVTVYPDGAGGSSLPSTRVPKELRVQETDWTGMYAAEFTAGGAYRIQVNPPAPAIIFPSSKYPPAEGYAKTGSDGYVSPDLSANTRGGPYYLRVDSSKTAAKVKNNRIPLDKADGVFSITKSVSRREATRGDIVVYTVSVVNTSGAAFAYNTALHTGGVGVRDYLPEGIRYVPHSARLYRVVNGRETVAGSVEPAGAAEITFSGISIGPAETVHLRYDAVVDLSARPGTLSNRARLFIGGRAVGQDATAAVRVVQDPIFDQGFLIGKVFCDADGNGVQDPGEEGLGGARVYIDTGWYADVDETGKFHFKGIPPGYHLVKLDVNTLPPGSLPSGEIVKGIHFTEGLPAKTNFAVDCRLKKYAAAGIEPLPEPVATAASPAETPGEWAEFGTVRDAGAVDASAADAGAPDAAPIDAGASDAAVVAAKKESAPPPVDAGAPPDTVSRAAGVGPPSGEDRSIETWVELPPPDSVTHSEFLAFRGGTAPGNTITIGNQQVPLREDGTFFATVKLMPGRNAVVVTAEDPGRHRARIAYTIEYDPESFFAMAFAEGVAGTGGLDLDGVTKATSLKTGDGVNFPGVLLHGKSVVYIKGRAKGRAGFDNIEYTLHFDSSKQRELQRDYFAHVYDPERYFPVYGDSASEVQDVQAQDKLYLLVKADDSKLLIGNFIADLHGPELFRYNRPLYGLDVDLNRTVLNGNLGNRATGFVSEGYENILHDRLVMKPTGGSVFYLYHGGVLEGSDRVDVVVRDKDSGMELFRRTLARDIDYTVNYAEGRIIFKQPVSMSADGFSTLTRPGLQMSGHPVFVEIDYDYDVVFGGGGNRAWGVRVEETFFKALKLGGGYVTEQAKERDTYRLWGADATLSLGKTASLRAEFARAESFDATTAPAFFSDDGGLNFSQMRAGGARGSAWLAEAQGDVGEALKRQEKFLFLKGYAQQIDPGFSSGTSILQQGMLKYGFDAIKALPYEMEVRLKGDVLNVDIPAQVMTAQLTGGDLTFDKYSAYTSWQKKIGPWKILAEDNYIFFKDNIGGSEKVSTDIAGAGVSYQIDRKWEVFGAQQGVIGGDAALYDAFPDRMFTTLGARYTIREGLVASASETARWSGDNATQVGLKVPLSNVGSAYVNERLGSWNGQFVSTSVFGAEDQSIPGTRTYGEYQIDSVSSNAMNRSVFGLNNRWPVARGTYFTLDFEHSQVVGGGPYFGSTDNALGSIPLSSSGYTAFGRPNQYAIAGSTGGRSPLAGEQAGLKKDDSLVGQYALVPFYGLNYPLGMMEGDSARDVFAVGLEFLRFDFFKVGGRLELRFDNADESYGGQDRYQYLATVGSTWRWTRDLSFLAKFSISDTTNQRYDCREARFMEADFGFALRPVQYDWINLIFKYSRLEDLRNLDVTAEHATQDSASDIFALVPIVETPFHVQVVEKVAFKHEMDRFYGQPWVTMNMLLWINRLNLHVWRDRIDVGGEYRMLVLLNQEQLDGWLVEAAILPAKYIRFGAGWNFSKFSDNLYEPLNRNASGFFVRLTGQY